MMLSIVILGFLGFLRNICFEPACTMSEVFPAHDADVYRENFYLQTMLLCVCCLANLRDYKAL